jgi:hypothetical protein
MKFALDVTSDPNFPRLTLQAESQDDANRVINMAAELVFPVPASEVKCQTQ